MAVAATVVLMVAGCVQTDEHTQQTIITIDPGLTYGMALPKGIAEARKAILINPDDPAPHYYLGKAFVHQNNIEAAEAEFQTIIALSPNSAGAYYELASINVKRGDCEHALEHLKRAIQLKPRFPAAHKLARHVYEMLGNFDKADYHHNAYLESLEARKKAGTKP